MKPILFVILFFSSLSFSQPAPKSAHSKTVIESSTTTVESSGAGDVTTETTVETTTESQPTLGEKAKADAVRAKRVVQGSISNAGDRRERANIVIVGEYSPFDLILPSKIGGAIGYLQSRSSTIEFEYLGASLSAPFFVKKIGGFDERRMSLMWRSYAQRNSLNFHFGISYFETGIHVGSEFLQSATNLPYGDLMRTRALGLIFGIGNRWVLPRDLTLGVDWLSWAQPLVVLQEDSSVINLVRDEGAKATLQDAFQLSVFFPRLTLLKVAVGLTF